MLAFHANKVLHGTRKPDMLGRGCRRIGSALALQTRAVNVAIAEHTAVKDKIAQKQQADCVNVKQRHASGVDRFGVQKDEGEIA